ncbi:MAG: hypothetical protein AB8I08_26375 [Sandaracinaceae bacterium]
MVVEFAERCEYATEGGQDVELSILSTDIEWAPDFFDARLEGSMRVSEDGRLISSGVYSLSFSSN